MPTLPDYWGVYQIQNKSPGLLYSLVNLPDKSEFGLFFSMKDVKSSKFYFQMKKKKKKKTGLYSCDILLDLVYMTLCPF